MVYTYNSIVNISSSNMTIEWLSQRILYFRSFLPRLLLLTLSTFFKVILILEKYFSLI